ncbi:MAG: hypothetical protein KGK35_03930, partial [Xanthomonadaceae bacterium]|nr:hypothetical protein [Xanthomonadaceae bacterium]
HRSPAMTHFRDLGACGVFEAPHMSCRCERLFDVFGRWVTARTRATTPCMNATMIVNLAT